MALIRGASHSSDIPVIIYFWCGLLWGYVHLRWGLYMTLLLVALVLPPLARHIRLSLPAVLWRQKVRTTFSYVVEGAGWILLIFSVIHL